jgi:RNA polymerase sigma factor (TIGR02999 family)
MGSSPASPESWPGDGSLTGGVPKKFGAFSPGRWYTRRSSRGSEKGEVPPMSEVTRILSVIEAGDPHAAEQLLPLVYEELRKLAAQKMAQEKAGQTLQATALVHEAYLRLVDTPDAQHWNGRGHFFAAAAEAMRRILVDQARRKGRQKRGGRLKRVELDPERLTCASPPDELLTVDDALQGLAREDPQAAELVKLRYFAGLSVEESAELAGLPRSTAYEHWAYARAWLHRCLKGAADPPGD